MKLIGLIGFPLKHSFSNKFFTDKFIDEHLSQFSHQNFELKSIDELPLLMLSHPELFGFNITIPYKEQVLPYLQSIDEAAAKIGAVNCVKVNRQSGINLKGYNTDWLGFWQSIKSHIEPHHQSALILGNGGSSKAVQYALSINGISFQVVSRRGALTYADLTEEIIRNHLLIINTTPLGMFPAVDVYPPIPYEGIGSQHLCYDLIYNPAETVFLTKCRLQGAAIKNGYDMLHIQAEESWRIWNS